MITAAERTDGRQAVHIVSERTDIYSAAVFSPCMAYRYTLVRQWDNSLPIVQVIGLNPSTADQTVNDPTVTRCVNYAKAWGCGSLVMTNIFGYRATDPKVMKAQLHPNGVENDFYLQAVAAEAKIVLGAWGVHGSHLNRQAEIIKLIPHVQCLGVAKDGSPRHPLYMKKDLWPVPWSFVCE